MSTTQLSRLQQAGCYLFGTGMLSLSAFLMVQHAQIILEVKDISVPLVAELPQLERRVEVLSEQLELTELSAATRVGSKAENVAMYALPAQLEQQKFLAVFEVLRELLERDGLLADMSSVELSEDITLDNGAVANDATLQLTIHNTGLQQLLLLVRVAGLITTGDAFTSEELNLLIDRIETENPTGLVALEHFLAVNLLDYAKDPKVHEEQLRRSFGSSTFVTSLQSLVRQSLLHDVKTVLGADIGRALDNYKLWPLQMMDIQELSVEPGAAPEWYSVQLKVRVYHQKEA